MFDFKRVSVTRASAVAGSGARNPHAVWEGDILWKIPFNKAGVPRKRYFQVVSRAVGKSRQLQLQWSDPGRSRQKARSLVLSTVERILLGHRTDAFQRLASKRGSKSKRGVLAKKNEHLCFSLVAKTRTIDLAAMNEQQRDDWLAGLESVVRHELNATPTGPPDVAAAMTPDIIRRVQEANSSSEGRQAAAAPERRAAWLVTMFQAAGANDVATVVALFDNEGCPVDLMDPSTGDTALLIAARHGWAELAHECLQRGARNDPHPTFGNTALQLAVSKGHYKVAELLLKIAAQSGSDRDIVNHADGMKAAALHRAAANGDVRCVGLLLEHFADVTLVEGQGRTPLHVACASSKSKAAGYLDCVLVLLDSGADAVIDALDNDGNTALHLSVNAGSVDIVRALLQSAAHPHIFNVMHETPSSLAAKRKNTDMMEILREYNAVDDADAEDAGIATKAQIAHSAATAASTRAQATSYDHSTSSTTWRSATSSTPSTAATSTSAASSSSSKSGHYDNGDRLSFRGLTITPRAPEVAVAPVVTAAATMPYGMAAQPMFAPAPQVMHQGIAMMGGAGGMPMVALAPMVQPQQAVQHTPYGAYYAATVRNACTGTILVLTQTLTNAYWCVCVCVCNLYIRSNLSRPGARHPWGPPLLVPRLGAPTCSKPTAKATPPQHQLRCIRESMYWLTTRYPACCGVCTRDGRLTPACVVAGVL